ncbi:RNA polymerase sigma factor [Rhodococcus sp. P1Y]|uniref:RNA polymerase sigma factor n=1 Tax=Rhodococcus sp. P1Y TaxID=1302308 RepID=UPI000EB37AC5|nr:sigma-70 family RNA polymerase sigma factor [Rhodococcus sp. P1Y]AYJ49304.1 sigma-70 family RNA polymerase sigma factor [Rhodococcus sp. P1Y]
MSDSASTSLEAVFREERGLLLAALVRRYGDLELAEDVTSEAIETALVRWPIDGVPTKPGAWLLTTARRRAVDRLRRDQAYAARLAILHVEQDRAAPAVDAASGDFPDERLQLFFTCAHPALHADDRVAIMLRCLAGFTTSEVARAFMIPQSTAGQRISRAKKKIAGTRIPFRVPDHDELAHRLPGVLQVVYSIFTEGYAASSGDDLVRLDLAEEALRLGRILHKLMPNEREVTGLLALMLLTHARHRARERAGELLLLDEQDRSLWDPGAISEGSALVVLALTGGNPGPYAVQAAIAAVHDEAPSVADTDWPQIVALYDVLVRTAPSPIVSLNRAVAIAMRDGPSAGLRLLDTLARNPAMSSYHPFHAARADLLHRMARFDEAADGFRRALELAGSEPERRYLRRRLEETQKSALACPHRGGERPADGSRPGGSPPN